MEVWYENCPVGKNTLNNFMAVLSKDAGLSSKYTNHCIRATCITALDHKGVEARHIMSISGHKSENSIRSYSERLSENKKRQISDILSENAIPSKIPKPAAEHSVTLPNDSVLSSDDFVNKNLQLPDFWDDDFEQIMTDITSYELNTSTSTSSTCTNNVPMNKTQASKMPTNFNFQNCSVNISFTNN